MSNEMPSPEELDKIQKENLTEEQIEKDKIREEAFEAGFKEGYELKKRSNDWRRAQESKRADDIRRGEPRA